MIQYVDKSAVIAEIEKLKGKVNDGSSYCNGWQHALRMLELSLDTLEVKEIGVDIDPFEGDLGRKTVQVIDADGNIKEITFNKAQKEE